MAHDPKATWPITSRLSRRAPKSPFRALDFSVKMLTSRCLRLAARSHRWVERRRDGRSAPSRSSQKKCRELPFSRRPRLPDRNTHKHSFEGLPIWAASKATTLPLSGDGAVAQRNSFPVRGRSRGFERGCHRGRKQSNGFGRQERVQDNSHCHCDDGGPGATRIRHEPRSPGRQHHVAQPPDAGLPRTGLPFVSKLPVT